MSLRGGGKTEIRVADDGSGMGREDALLALDRHATSKIREAEDLHRVSSFGFRGEALPSIAAVSRFELETAAAGGGAGTRIRVRNGRIGSVDDVARRAGTTVTVRALFGDLPARAKFLKSASAETRACSEAVVLLALANLPAAFRLESNGRLLLDLPSGREPAGARGRPVGRGGGRAVHRARPLDGRDPGRGADPASGGGRGRGPAAATCS